MIESRTAAQVTPATSTFAWAGRVPLGAPTIVAGPPGLGKTQLLIGMIARLTRGKLDGDLHGETCEALYVSAEDSLEHTLVPRFLAAGGIPDYIHFFDAIGDRTGFQIPADVANLDLWLQDHPRVRIVVLDPVVAMIPANLNAHRDQHVRQALAPVASLLDKHQVAGVLVMHLNKDREADALNRLSGSIGFGGAARSVLLFAKDPDDPKGEAGNRRVLAHVKCNVGKERPSIAYRIESRRLDSRRQRDRDQHRGPRQRRISQRDRPAHRTDQQRRSKRPQRSTRIPDRRACRRTRAHRNAQGQRRRRQHRLADHRTRAETAEHPLAQDRQKVGSRTPNP
jgi:RecA-family ATPase